MKEIDLQVGWGPFSQSEDGIQQREIFICTFAMLAKLVSSDGDIGKQEISLIDHLMKQTMKLDDTKRQFVTKVFNLARKTPTSFEEYARRYKLALRKKPKMYEWLIDLLFRIALADEVLAPEELTLLKSACNVLGITEEKFSEIRSRYVTADEVASSAFGLPIGTPFEKIRDRYDMLLAKYDVERLIEGDFAEELIDLAHKKQAELTSTFLKVRKQYQNS